ncbi:hypothetical protein RJ639_014476 [Escallonia herrerae]|uniref:Retrotransposon gag domain-containing protein n=1 Tax=Escallonia herrerae TaxID=1293975 RepID=A0AA88VPM2_9ASTE|nr:hypothetical protein RJ639_014476 [Escallonia herrerae]
MTDAVATASIPATVISPAVTIAPPSTNTVLPPLQTANVSAPTTTLPVMSGQADLMAVLQAMQQTIERLQAAVDNQPPSEQHVTGTRRQPVKQQLNFHEEAGTSKTPERIQVEDGQSDDERRNPRSRRQESSYEAHSTRRDSYEHRAERYTSAPVIIGRPFTEEVDHFPTPQNFKMPPCESYDGTGDPMEHLARFTSGMNLHLVPDQIMCRAFPVTLKGAAHVWFQHLAPRSISCWAQLAESFRNNFLTSRIQRKNSSSLFCIVQGPKESLKSYYARFNTEKLLIDNLDSGVTFPAMARGVRSGTPLGFSLNKRPPENMADLLDRDHGHTTEECKVLRREIENLIARGHLKQFVKTERLGGKRGGGQRRHDDSAPKEPPVINTISGGLSAGGTSRSARKAYARQVNLTQGPAKRPKAPATISFDDTDLEEVLTPHDDALVISLQIDAYVIKRILVDTGSSADILFEEAFSQMKISRERIRPVSSPLYGFTGASAPVEGVIPLTVVAGSYPLQATQSIDFLVVKIKSAYNGILGQVDLNKLQAIALTFHLCMKFPTPNGIGVAKGDQAIARKCYMASCKAEEALGIEDQRDEHTFRRAKPVENLCLPFFKALKNIKNFEWTAECQTSFEALKEYLTVPPLLSKPLAGEELFSYLAIAESAVSAVLVRNQNKKLAFALLIAARKLRPYFQSHSITVLTDKPLRRILHKPDVSGRLVPWSIELGEFDIHYKPRPSIKGQALADFIVECTLPIEDEEQLPQQEGPFTWTLHVDARYTIVDDVLYKRSFTLPYLRCLTPTEATYALRETEVTNRTLLQGLKKKLDGAKGLWVDELHKILWAYRTTTRNPIGETPFNLAFGTEALIPVEIGLPSLRLLTYDLNMNDEALRCNLDLLDEQRDQAQLRLAAYQRRVARYHDRRIRPLAFRIGDLVLCRVEASTPRDAIGKLSPNWEGPYRVTKYGGPGSYHLEHLDGKSIPRTWNATNLRRYHA